MKSKLSGIGVDMMIVLILLSGVFACVAEKVGCWISPGAR